MGTKLELTGQKFNKLTVIREYGKDKKGNITWLCKCDCGNFKVVRGQELTGNKVKSCGCSKFRDLSGQKFGKLTVIKRVENIGKQVAYLCRCDCGNTKIVKADYLREGYTKSCGCLTSAHPKHRMIHTRLYRIWMCMKNRCNNEKHNDFFNYGGRGISICEDWLDKQNGFINFYNWAVSTGYNDTLTIDRIDNNKNYMPSNCRWVPLEEQPKNRRNVLKIKYNNNVYTMPELSKILNISYYNIYKKFKNVKRDKIIEYY